MVLHLPTHLLIIFVILFFSIIIPIFGSSGHNLAQCHKPDTIPSDAGNDTASNPNLWNGDCDRITGDDRAKQSCQMIDEWDKSLNRVGIFLYGISQ